MTEVPELMCENCGRTVSRLFPREGTGQVCTHCYETLARREFNPLVLGGTLALLVGSALLVVAVIAAIVNLA